MNWFFGHRGTLKLVHCSRFSLEHPQTNPSPDALCLCPLGACPHPGFGQFTDDESRLAAPHGVWWCFQQQWGEGGVSVLTGITGIMDGATGVGASFLNYSFVGFTWWVGLVSVGAAITAVQCCHCAFHNHFRLRLSWKALISLQKLI